MASSPAAAVLDHFRDLPTDLRDPLAGALEGELSVDAACGPGTAVSELVEALSGVPDPRCARGVRHDVLVILVITACAVLSGARSYAAISEWAAELGRHVLARLDRVGPTPCESTLRRCLQAIDPPALEAALSGWLAGRLRLPAARADRDALGPVAGRRAVIAVDGKTLRGSAARATPTQVATASTGGGRVALVAALDQVSGILLSEVPVAETGGEVAAARTLLADLHARGLLTGAVVTGDAAYTQREHAEQLFQAGAHYLFTVKANQPTLLARCKALPWTDVPDGARVRGRGHGRVETCTIRVLALDPCPDVGQPQGRGKVVTRALGLGGCHREGTATRRSAPSSRRPTNRRVALTWAGGERSTCRFEPSSILQRRGKGAGGDHRRSKADSDFASALGRHPAESGDELDISPGSTLTVGGSVAQ
jgi:DDE_Tnp_1-associated/Transposase DDE domain